MRGPIIAVSWALSSCAPSGPTQERAQGNASDATNPVDGIQGYTPMWSAGQTWGVHYDHFRISMTADPDPVRASTEWRYEVVSRSADGLIGIEIVEVDYKGRRASNLRVWELELHETGQVTRFYPRRSWIEDDPPPRPFLPFVDEWVSLRHLVPWWPRFPLVPGETWSFLGGDITQTVTEVDGTLRVELRASENQRTSLTTMEWERGRPFWSRVEVIEWNDGEDPEIPYHIRGRVVTWDRSNPWPLPHLPRDSTP